MLLYELARNLDQIQPLVDSDVSTVSAAENASTMFPGKNPPKNPDKTR